MQVTVEPLPEWNLQNLGAASYRPELNLPILLTLAFVLLARVQSLTSEFSSGLAVSCRQTFCNLCLGMLKCFPFGHLCSALKNVASS